MAASDKGTVETHRAAAPVGRQSKSSSIDTKGAVTPGLPAPTGRLILAGAAFRSSVLSLSAVVFVFVAKVVDEDLDEDVSSK